MTSRTIIRIGGTAYSGSTLLDLMLSSADKAFSCGEVFAVFRPFRMHHFSPDCTCRDRNCPIWAPVIASGEKRLWQSLSGLMPDVQFFIDSSKDLVWLKDSIERQSDEFRYVDLLIWKSPAEYAFSRMKRGKLRGWKKSYIRYHERYFAIVKNWRTVRYSDLAMNPNEKLKFICRAATIPFREGLDKYWEKQHHSLFGSLSARLHLYDKQSVSFEDIAQSRAKYKPQIENGNDLEITKHKSIYYDQNVMSKLPALIQKEINTDSQLEQIAKLLEAKEVDNPATEAHQPYLVRGTATPLWYQTNSLKRNLKYSYCRVLMAFGYK